MTRSETMVSDASDASWCDGVLHFWFDDLSFEQWWRKDAALDARIRGRFLSLYKDLASHPVVAAADPRVALAAVIVLDQFPRNMFRNDPRAFLTDPLARAVAARAIAEGRDLRAEKGLRAFIYLPFEHSENMADQERSITLFAPLGEDSLKWAVLHADIIRKFGRFPHRNAVLGRATTPEETAFLKDGGFSG